MSFWSQLEPIMAAAPEADGSGLFTIARKSIRKSSAHSLDERLCSVSVSAAVHGQLVEKEIKSGNPAVPGNDEISPGIGWRITRAARYPLDSPAIAQFLGLGNRPIAKVRVSGPDRGRDAIDLVAATVDTFGGIVKNAIFSEDLVDGGTPTRGVVFTEDVLKIAG
jgi:hypothetical protein